MPFWLHQSITPVPTRSFWAKMAFAPADELAAETVAGVTSAVTLRGRARVIGHAVVAGPAGSCWRGAGVCTEWMGPVIMPMCSDVCSSRAPVASQAARRSS